jgi:glutamate racemase
MVSFNITALYTKIPIKEVIFIMKDAVKAETQQDTKVMALTRITVDKNYMQQHVDGIISIRHPR